MTRDEANERNCPACGVLYRRGTMPPSQWKRKIYCSSPCGSGARSSKKRMAGLDALNKLFSTATITETGCIIPDRKPDASGYVIARADGKHIKAHRLSYAVIMGEVPDGMVVMHTCDVRNCINPRHLTIGSVADNNRDRDMKGRQAKGERQGRARLTDDIVRQIRASQEPHAVLAQRLGVGVTAVSNVRSGKRWTHVR